MLGGLDRVPYVPLAKRSRALTNWVNVKDPLFRASGDAVTDDTAAIQAAHDALPSTGGTIFFPDGYFNLAVDGTYVNITKPNVIVIGGAGAWLVSPASSDAEVRTGNRYLNGFNVTGNNFVCSVNMRGPLVKWTSGSAKDVITLRDMTCLNMYNSGLSINDAPFALADVDGVIFDTSRDLASDAGNYEAISRSCNGDVAKVGEVIRVNRCLFRGVAGGIDAHNIRNLVIGGGTRFEGCDVSSIKLATLDNVATEMNLVVDESVTFSGAAVNAASANRHSNCTGLGRATANASLYGLFIQVFDNVRVHGKFKGFGANPAVAFLDGSFVNAVINLDGVKFDTCTNAVLDAQGAVTMRGAEFISSNWLHTVASVLRSLEISRCRFRDSAVSITKNSVALGDVFRFENNDVDYSVDNNGPIRFVNYGSDTGPLFIVDNNKINITGGGNTLAANLAVAGTKGIWGPGNQPSAGYTLTGGIIPNAYEQSTGAATSLYLLKLHHGEVTVLKADDSNTTQYAIQDAVLACPIGTVFHGVRTNATAGRVLQFSCVGGTINGFVTCQLGAQYDSVTLKKIAANTWVAMNYRGTVTFF